MTIFPTRAFSAMQRKVSCACENGKLVDSKPPEIDQAWFFMVFPELRRCPIIATSPPPSLRAQRSNPAATSRGPWIASSQELLAMTVQAQSDEATQFSRMKGRRRAAARTSARGASPRPPLPQTFEIGIVRDQALARIYFGLRPVDLFLSLRAERVREHFRVFVVDRDNEGRLRRGGAHEGEYHARRDGASPLACRVRMRAPSDDGRGEEFGLPISARQSRKKLEAPLTGPSPASGWELA